MRQTSFEKTGKPDDYVNGYDGGVMTKNPKKLALAKAVDIYMDKYKYKRVDNDILKDIFKNYLDLVDNTDEGYQQRTDFFEKYLKIFVKNEDNDEEEMFTNAKANEAGYINEYWWYHNNGRAKEWHPWDRFLTDRDNMYSDIGYYATLDYKSPTAAVEIKTLKYFDVNGKKHPYPRFVIPKVKINAFKYAKSAVKQICYVLCQSYDEIITGRQSQSGFWVTYNMANWDNDLDSGNICPIIRKSSKTNQDKQASFVIRYNCMLLSNPELESFYGKPAMDKESNEYKNECNDIRIHSRLDYSSIDFIDDEDEKPTEKPTKEKPTKEKPTKEEPKKDTGFIEKLAPFNLSEDELEDLDLLTNDEKIEYIEARTDYPGDKHKWYLVRVLNVKSPYAVDKILDERSRKQR